MAFLDRIIDVEQGTDEWYASRAGKVTGSAIEKVTAKGKGGAEAATRRAYRVQIVTEILTGEPTTPGFQNSDMAWGKEWESAAREAYEAASGLAVTRVGFVLHPTIARAGCSPDGLVSWDGFDTPPGLTQIKCPASRTHLDYLLAGVVPEDYKPQMTWEMVCTGAKWCDFVSYDPRMPEHLRLFVVRYELDQVLAASLNRAAGEFLGEVDEMMQRLEALRPAPRPVPADAQPVEDEEVPL